ncbi:hypothetical protein O3Q52_21600, partial [Streptomyces sp. ActVer]|nr:hypothetical protein [Streptomyces sp. ActVer]
TNASAHAVRPPAGADERHTPTKFEDPLYDPSGLRPINRVFKIKANARTLERDSGSRMTEWCRSTTTHELGHALSLDDNPNTGRVSLMKHGRNRTTVQKPQPYDVSEVRRIYS